MARSADSLPPLSVETLLKALLTLQIDNREQQIRHDDARLRTELLLADSGLSYQDIAALMNKKPDAVRMMVTRRRTAPKTKKAPDDGRK